MKWLASSDASTLEPNLPASPSYDASFIEDDEDLATGLSYLDPNRTLIPTVDAVAGNHDEGFEVGTRHLEPNPQSTPTVDAVAANRNEGFASATEHLEPDHVDAVTADPNEGFAAGTSHLLSDPPSKLSARTVAAYNKESFKCPLCGKCVSRQVVLDGHMKSHAAGKFPCSVKGCNYHTAKSQLALDFHVRVDHADVTQQREGVRFECWHCGRNMHQRNPLLYHVKLHEAGKFPCPIDNCSSRTHSTQYALDEHLNNEHTDAEISGSFL